MTTTNGGIKNADAPSAPPPPSNFDLYAGDFSCDDDISFENLLQLDNDIDKPQPSCTLHQSTASPPSEQICRQPSTIAVQPSSVVGSDGGDVPLPTADTVVYLLTTSALRPPNSAVGPGYDTLARNNVRPLLRFQISKKPITTAVSGYGIELAGPVVTAGSTLQQPAPGALALQTATGCDLASITSIGDRVAAVPVRCPPMSSDPRCLTLTSAFNGELPVAAQRSLAAAVGAGTFPGTRISKPTHPPSSAVSSSKSRSAAAADARQTVQEKNAYEYERVMDILRYYRELVVERKLPGACLPCKRRKSKPLVSADTVTPISTRPSPLPPPAAPLSTTIAAARSANQYVRAIAVSTWRGPSAPVLCLTTSRPATAAGMLTTTVASSLSSAPTRPAVPISDDATAIATADRDDVARMLRLSADDLTYDEMPSRPSSVELGTTARSQSLADDLLDCSKDVSRTCRSAPGLCEDDDDGFPGPSTTVSNKTTTTLECRRAQMDVFNRSRRQRSRRRSVDLRRFVSRTPGLRHADHSSQDKQHDTDCNDGQIEEKPAEDAVWMKPVAMLPVKDIATRTTDTIVVKWTKAHLAIAGPYQSWT